MTSGFLFERSPPSTANLGLEIINICSIYFVYMKKPKSKKFLVEVDIEDLEKFDALCKHLKWTRAFVVREMIRALGSEDQSQFLTLILDRVVELKTGQKNLFSEPVLENKKKKTAKSSSSKRSK